MDFINFQRLEAVPEIKKKLTLNLQHVNPETNLERENREFFSPGFHKLPEKTKQRTNENGKA